MVIKLKGDLDRELISLGLKAGDIIHNASNVQLNNAVNFTITHSSGVDCCCAAWPENYDIICAVWPENYDIISKFDGDQKEVIGYILDPQFSWCEKAILAIHSMDPKDPNFEYWFAKESVIAQLMEKAGVMHWFLPVYDSSEEE